MVDKPDWIDRLKESQETSDKRLEQQLAEAKSRIVKPTIGDHETPPPDASHEKALSTEQQPYIRGNYNADLAEPPEKD